MAKELVILHLAVATVAELCSLKLNTGTEIPHRQQI